MYTTRGLVSPQQLLMKKRKTLQAHQKFNSILFGSVKSVVWEILKKKTLSLWDGHLNRPGDLF